MKLRILTLLLITLLLFTACGGSSYRTDLPSGEAAAQVLPALSSGSLLAEADPDYITYRLMLDSALMEDCAVYIQNAGSSLDEFGIIRTATEKTGAVEIVVKEYLAARVEEWTGQYLVDQFPKLESADCRVFGNYVAYAILSPEDRAVFYESVEKALSK